MALNDLLSTFGNIHDRGRSQLDALVLPPLPPSDPKPARCRRKPQPARPLRILDIETEPFRNGRTPEPFAVGIYDPQEFRVFWGPDCIAQSVCYLRTLTPGLIYAHNGGGFDIKGYYQEFLEGGLRIINGRIVVCHIGKQEIRDSYSIMPFPLRDYKKDEIDYAKFEKNRQNRHRKEIIDYLKGDCAYLFDLVSTFHSEFGQSKITIGSTAMEQIQKLHSFETVNISFDRDIRPKFYYGGRNQCFEAGIIEDDINIYDVNSMYPYVMQSMSHPVGSDFCVGDEITEETCFLEVEGENDNAFLVREKGGGLDFTQKRGVFSMSIHEYRAAVETGSFRPARVLRTFDFWEQGNFAEFVTHFYNLRKDAAARGDEIRKLLYKFVLNSGYGKFAQNPANFDDWLIAKEQPADPCKHCKGTGKCRDCFKCEAINDYNPTGGICYHCEGTGFRWILHEFTHALQLYRAQSGVHHFYNVATGASITGAARSILLRGIRDSERPLYCDTDSIICRKFHGKIDKAELGAWKHEGRGTVAAICGKKLYAIFTDRKPKLSIEDSRKYPWMLKPVRYRGMKLYCIKKAHKGCNASPDEILRIARGEEIEFPNPVPSFKLGSGAKAPAEAMFISRRIRRTAKL